MSTLVSLFLTASFAASSAFAAPQDGQAPLDHLLLSIADHWINSADRRLIIRSHSSWISPR